MQPTTFKYEKLGIDIEQHIEETLAMLNEDRETPLTASDLVYRVRDLSRGPAHVRLQISTQNGGGIEKGYLPSDYGWSHLKPLRRNTAYYLEHFKSLTPSLR